MSRLNKLMGKPITIELEGELFEIHPLKMKQLPLLMEASSKNEAKQAEALQKIMKFTLLKAVPDATDEELEEISVKYFQILSDAIMKANGLDNVPKQKG